MYTSVHLNVAMENGFFDVSFDLKSVYWKLLNYLYSETHNIHLWFLIF